MTNTAPELRDSTEVERPDAARPAGAGTSTAPAGGEAVQLPADALPILPIRNSILFPGVVIPLSVARPRSLAAIQHAVRNKAPIGVILQRDAETADPSPADLHAVGTIGVILRYATAPDGSHHIICGGDHRFRAVEFLEGYPFLAARVQAITEAEATGTEVEARMMQLKEQATEALKLIPDAPEELAATLQAITAPSAAAYVVTNFLDIKIEEKQQILEIDDVRERLDRVLWFLAHRLEVLRLSHDIGKRTRETMEGRQREFLLREQMKTIQKELGEGDDKGEETASLAEAIAKAKMPADVEKHARKELARLERMSDQSGESSMVRTYLEWLSELPWSAESGKDIDIAKARAVLEADHHGLEKIKRRIVEFLAVRKLAPEGRSPILCFVGPPGVGKTSLGQSIARALGRKFVRVSLGGVHDEAELRGHRRTYIGALPGNVIQAIKKAGSRDCVMMLDEVDKVGQGFHGDPNAALLEVLDPEQNNTFRDNYLGVPFDLSKVVFITTANVLDSIPGPLRDRMEIIQLPGYTEEEKLEIAKRYLVRRQLEANGLKADQVQAGDAVLATIVRDYTREAGMRNLEREIGSVLRHAAVRIAEGASPPVRIDVPQLAEILGPARFEAEVAERAALPGVATGLAWTPVGGDILFVEASRTPGSGKLILTGQLGDVMKESAQAALTLVKSSAGRLGIDGATLDKSDIHVHVPAGAIPKDGPSAGVAMFMALTSLLSDRAVRNDTAMTGEISLRGLVLPVGGIKEKVLAAMRAGIKTVMLPAKNRKDLVDVPEGARERLQFVWLETVDDAARHALAATGEKPARTEAVG